MQSAKSVLQGNARDFKYATQVSAVNQMLSGLPHVVFILELSTISFLT